MDARSEIAVFVRTVDLGTFAAAGQEIGLTSSGVSRIVSRLEASMGVRLFHRSTRRLVLTQEGESFLPHARAVLASIEAARAAVAATRGKPTGHLRVNTGTAFAKHKLAPVLPQFLEQHPGISLDLTVGDRRVDPIAEQIDVTIRVGPLADSALVGLRLGEVRRIIAASPAYLARRGAPVHPRDLLDHDCLLLTGFARLAKWPMLIDGRRQMLPVKGALRSDSAEVLLDMALSGAGLIRVGDFLGEKAIAEGRLVPLLEGLHDPDPQPITGLILPGRQSIPRVRCFTDFLKKRLRQSREAATSPPVRR